MPFSQQTTSRQLRALRDKNRARYRARELVAEVAESGRLVRGRSAMTLIALSIIPRLPPAPGPRCRGLLWSLYL